MGTWALEGVPCHPTVITLLYFVGMSLLTHFFFDMSDGHMGDIDIYVCIYIHTHVCIYIHVHICLYVYVYVHI